MSKEDMPERDLSGIVYDPNGNKRDILDKHGNVIMVDNKATMIDLGLGWGIHYEFTVAAGDTVYLLFEASTNIHPTNRRVVIIDTVNQAIDVDVSTYKGITIDSYGVDISEQVTNLNFNYTNNVGVTMYDETTEITTNGAKLPYSARVVADKKTATQLFIDGEYVLADNSAVALEFKNNGGGEVTIQYNSNGYQYPSS